MGMESVAGYLQQVKKCLEIAVSCVEADRHRRPAMGDIIHKLNQTETILTQQLDSEMLLHVHAMELPFMLSSSSSPLSSSCSLQLDNKGNDGVAFMLVANSASRYLAKEPLYGVVPPRCAYTLTLTMHNNKQPPPSPSLTDSGVDYFTLYSILVGQYDLDKGTVPPDYGGYFKKAKEKASREVQEVTLNVSQQQADRGTSSEVNNLI